MDKNWRVSLFVLRLKQCSSVKIAQQSAAVVNGAFNTSFPTDEGFFSRNACKSTVKHFL